MSKLRQGFPVLAAATLVFVGFGWGEPAEGQTPATGESLNDTCAACHEDQVTAFARNPHAVLDRPDRQGAARQGSCTACHGDATQHLEEGGGAGTIFAFGEGELASVKSQQCLSCHGDAHSRFPLSPHAAAGLDCTSCHGIHSAAPEARYQLLASESDRGAMVRPGSASATCSECHADVFTQFQFNERHRLAEGILDCSTCHNPHEPSNRLLLGGFKQQACADCHTDKAGPFVFEHGSVQVEGCTACHTPHGSPNRHMLTFQRTAELCFSCHAAVPGFHSRFTLDTVCTNCHSTIHGSNFDPAFLK